MTNIVKDLAPIVYDALMGNDVKAVFDAAKGVADIFGWTGHSEDVKTQVNALDAITPEQHVELIKLNDQFQAQQLKTQDTDIENARSYSVKHLFADIFASIVSLIWAINLIFPKFLPLNDIQLNYLYSILGAIVIYYFGAGELPLKNIWGFVGNGSKKGQ